jgi:hypothetical protein
MKPIKYGEIVKRAEMRALAVEAFVARLETIPQHWSALCDASSALNDIYTEYHDLDAEARRVVSDAVGIGEVPLHNAMAALDETAKAPGESLLKLLAVLYTPTDGVPAEIKE